LQRVIDVEALDPLVNSTSPCAEIGIRFTVGESHVLVTDYEVTLYR